MRKPEYQVIRFDSSTAAILASSGDMCTSDCMSETTGCDIECVGEAHPGCPAECPPD